MFFGSSNEISIGVLFANTLVLYNFSIGVNVKLLIDRPDGTYCFREKKDRVYYISERLLQLAQTVKPEHLISAGTCFGKFTKTNKFRYCVVNTFVTTPLRIYEEMSAFFVKSCLK